MEVLIFNVGSSSLKWTVLGEGDSIVAQGNGEASATEPGALRVTVERIRASASGASVVGHRIVHGGSVFQSSIRIDEPARRALEQLAALDPLHMRPALALLDAAQAVMPALPHIAAFDTAFHHTLSAAAAGYAVPKEWGTLAPQGIELRRYGFHGLSVEWSIEHARDLFGELPRRVLVAHLGSGCSVTAVLDGKSIDTTMGFTPLDGLMMGTRPGALDPGLLIFLARECGLGMERLSEDLEKRSGLLGVSGISANLKTVMAAADRGDARAQLAYDRFIAYGRRGLGAMAGSLGGVDALIFTGGIGEHSSRVRADLAHFLGEAGRESVRVLVVHAREDVIIARDARRLMRVDNLTHAVIGLIAGESVAHAQRVDRTRRTLLIAAFTIGGNLPDLDLLASYRGMMRGKLEYMLQHRGYTHTVLGCIILGILLYGALELFARWRHLALSSRDRRLLLFAALAGTLLHIFMDFLNSYGVHPFWPLDNRWYYGDSVFIIEPLYWIAAAPLFFVERTWPARAFVAIVVGLAIVLSIWSQGLVPPPLVLAATALAAVLFAAGRRLTAPAAAFLSLTVWLGSTAVFIACGGAATAAAQRLAESRASQRVTDSAALPAAPNDGVREYATLADHVLTPMPANPLCWDMILIQEQDGRMRLRHGVLSIAPMILSARACPARLAGESNTAPLVPVPQADTESVRWLGELEMPAGAFAQVAAGSCAARALMQFVRAPFLAKLGDTAVIGDLRFDREPGLGFSELAIRDEGDAARTGHRAVSCPATPPWTPPRAELLAWPH